MSGTSADIVAVALGAVLGGDAHVDNVALDQHGGVYEVSQGGEDGEIGAVGRGRIDLAVLRVLGVDYGARMADDGQRLLHGVAGEIGDGDSLVSLVCRVSASAVSKHGDAGRIVADGNGVGGAEGGAVVAVFIEADVDQGDGAAIVVGNHKLARGLVELSIDGAGDGAHAGNSVGRRDVGGRNGSGGQRQKGMAVDGLSVLIEEGRAGVDGVVLRVDDRDGVVSAVEDEKAFLVSAVDGEDGALAEGQGRVSGVG